jgi:hypothetical protein
MAATSSPLVAYYRTLGARGQAAAIIVPDCFVSHIPSEEVRQDFPEGSVVSAVGALR